MAVYGELITRVASSLKNALPGRVLVNQPACAREGNFVCLFFARGGLGSRDYMSPRSLSHDRIFAMIKYRQHSDRYAYMITSGGGGGVNNLYNLGGGGGGVSLAAY